MSNRSCGVVIDHFANACRADAIACATSAGVARANSPTMSVTFEGLISEVRSVESIDRPSMSSEMRWAWTISCKSRCSPPIYAQVASRGRQDDLAIISHFKRERPFDHRIRTSNFLPAYASRVRWIVRGDIDGFFGLALDNLVQLLLIDTLCRGVLGFPPELVYGRVLPGGGDLDPGRQRRLRAAGAAAGGAHGTPRRLRAALRHQHGVALRARLPRHAAGEGARGAGRRRRSRRASRGRRACSRRWRPASSSWRAPSSPSASARRRRARRCSRRWPASRSASSRSASCSARSRTRSSA